MASPNILVIKLSALGDFIQALGPMKAIREFHKGAHITLLTTAPYADFAKDCPYFDEIWIDERPKALALAKWAALRSKLRGGNFERVYDLQTSGRSNRYFKLFWPGPIPQWSGIAKGCSHPHSNPKRDLMHTIERQAEQLVKAGIPDTPFPDLSWVEADISRFGLPKRYALIVPGGAAHRPTKRWPSTKYAELSARLTETGITPVLIGAGSEKATIDEITKACPQALSLLDRTSFQDIAALAKEATLAIGNDTGPMHMIAIAGCASIVLYSDESDPALCAQRGPKVTLLRRERLDQLDCGTVWETLSLF